MTRLLGRAWLRLFGWEVEGGHPGVKKAVIVAAPHTSNWDLPFTVATAWAIGLKMKWVAKHTIFAGPFGWFLRSIGGVAIDRRASQNFVNQIVDLLNSHDELMLIVAPEETRTKVARWKTGFYHMARGAQVPIVLGFLDYERKRGGLGDLFYPTGDLEADAEHLRVFYKNIKGRNPRQMSEISFTERAE